MSDLGHYNKDIDFFFPFCEVVDWFSFFRVFSKSLKLRIFTKGRGDNIGSTAGFARVSVSNTVHNLSKELGKTKKESLKFIEMFLSLLLILIPIILSSFKIGLTSFSYRCDIFEDKK